MGFGFALVVEKGERHVGYTRVIVFFLDGEKLKMHDVCTLISSISEGETGGLSVREPQLWVPLRGPLL